MRTGWKKSRANELFKIQGGNAFKSSEASSKGIRWLKIANVGMGKIKWQEERFLPSSFKNSYPNYLLNESEIVVAMTRPILGDVLKIAQITKEDLPCLLNQRVGRLIPGKDVDESFLYQLLNTRRIAYRLKSELLGTDPPNLSIKTFRSIEIAVPPLPEQKAIANILSTWDQAIEKIEQLIKAKERRFEYFLSCLTGTGTNQNKDIKLCELYENDISVEKGKPSTKSSSNKGDIPVVAGGKSYADFVESYTHDGETVTVSSSGANAGYVWYHDYQIWASDCSVLSVKKSEAKYLYYALKRLQNKIYTLQSGGAQPHVYPKDFKNLMVYWPNLTRQKEIVEELSAYEGEITLLKKLSTQYETQKRGLMQRLLTGEWRVKI